MSEKDKRQKPQFAYSIKKAGLTLGVGKTSIYRLISTGALWTITIGKRQLVPWSALEGFMKSAANKRVLRG